MAALIYLLKHRALTLLDPTSWDDTNDSYYLSVYKEKKLLRALLALCFTETFETYHHWRVFASGSSGVCITFRREKLLNAINDQPGISFDSVNYLKLSQMRENNVTLARLPFIKRYGFQDECEFRVIYESRRSAIMTKDIAIPLSAIEKVTLSPWIPKVLASPLKGAICSIQGCAKLKVGRSGLVGNTEWKGFANEASP